MKINNKSILVIGDVFLDIFGEYNTIKISPEAPIPVIKKTEEKFFIGGAANVANNIKSIGGNAFLISRGSSDKNSYKLKKLLFKNKINNIFFKEPGYPTIIKERYFSQNQQLLRVDNDKIFPIGLSLEKKIIKFIKKNIDKFSILLISDYAKGLLTRNLLRKITYIFNINKKLILCDPKSEDLSIYKGVDIMCPNEKEFLSFFKEKDLPKKSMYKQIKSKTNFKNLIITKSDKGIVIVNNKFKEKTFKKKKVQVFDVTGAGDSFVGIMAHLLNLGYNLEKSTEISSLCCSIIVTKKYTSVLNVEEFNNTLNLLNQNKNSKQNKLDGKFETIKKWKNQNYIVGATSGCFDIIHPGHFHLFEECKKKCDKLIVLLNSDHSVRLIKGNNRPINKFNIRSKILNRIQLVNMIIPFDQKTPLNLIKKIKPKYLFKGSDYNKKDVVGYYFMRKNKGEVVIINKYKNFSSSKLLNK